MYWDGHRKRTGMTYKISIGMDTQNVLGWKWKMHWNGHRKCIGMAGPGPGSVPGGKGGEGGEGGED
eukprot:7727584-Karenia_brevis.AAC.1